MDCILKLQSKSISEIEKKFTGQVMIIILHCRPKSRILSTSKNINNIIGKQGNDIYFQFRHESCDFSFKSQWQCFSMQVKMNKCFLLNPEKNLTQIHLVVFQKNAITVHLIPKNDVTEPKAKLL